MTTVRRLRNYLARAFPFIYGMFFFSVTILPVIFFFSLPSTLQSVQNTGVEEWADGEILDVNDGTISVVINKGGANERVIEVPRDAEKSLKSGTHVRVAVKPNGSSSDFLNSLIKTQLLFLLSCVVGFAGAFIPSWLPLFKCERDRRFYERLGIQRFRRYATGGEIVNKMSVMIDPDDRTHPRTAFNLSALPFHKAWYDLGERCHWAALFVTLPATIWAAFLGQFGFVFVFCVTNIFINVYPIMLERYMRARVEAVERHPRYKADFSLAQNPQVDQNSL